MALYFECRISNNALLQTVFLAILPTGKASGLFYVFYFVVPHPWTHFYPIV